MTLREWRFAWLGIVGSSCHKVNMNRAVCFPSDFCENGALALSVPISRAASVPLKGPTAPCTAEQSHSLWMEFPCQEPQDGHPAWVLLQKSRSKGWSPPLGT